MQQNQKTFALVMLMLIYALGYVDRMALGVVLQSIKVDLDLTDTQLGLLTGLAFSAFYTLIGLPIARWADRGDRVAIISLSTAVWAIAVALCSMAGSFTPLLLTRMLVAIGDVGSGPPANSLMPELFSRAERPRAVGRYMLGIPIGMMGGYLAGGWLSEIYGWRMTFVIIGVPGLVLAVLAALWMHEPRRLLLRQRAEDSSIGSTETGTVSKPTLREVITTLARNTTFRHLLAFFSVWYFCGWAFQTWIPTFFVRSHGLSAGELGTWLAAIYGSTGLLGSLLGGEWGSRYARYDERAQFRAVAVVTPICCLLGMGALLAENHYLAFACVAVWSLGGAFMQGPVYGSMQTLVHPSMRATALTFINVIPGFIGMGLGPSAIGILSDSLQPSFGSDSLRYALLAVSPGYLWVGWHLYRASRNVTTDIANVLREDVGPAGAPGGTQRETATANSSAATEDAALSPRT